MTDVQSTTATDLSADESGLPAAGSTRRFVLLGAGAAGATCLLAACGTDSGSTNSNGDDFSTNPAPAGSENAAGGDSGSAGGSTLAAVADVPEGGGVIKGDLVITQPTAGTYKAFSKVCTHQGCDVSKIDAGVIICACHNSKFSIETGEPTGGPATKPLAETQVKVDGENIVKA